MRKSFQLLFTFLIIFIILSLDLKRITEDAQKVEKKNCPHKISMKGMCIPLECLNKCKKQYGTPGSCSEEKGFCNCACK
ncbi:hypothetical protein N665_0766s0010 [Sinapis alba]|nr:hypothetical protein N665_0766s0010 [Sinapis alba]